MNSTRATLIEVIAVILILGILGALFIPMVITTGDCGPRTACRNNLRELHKCVLLYSMRFGGPSHEFPRVTGSALWATLMSDPTDVPGGNEGFNHDLLSCPESDRHHTNGDYYGPTRMWSESDPNSLIAADKAGNDHADGGGNAIRKNSQIVELDPVEFEAMTKNLTSNNLKD